MSDKDILLAPIILGLYGMWSGMIYAMSTSRRQDIYMMPLAGVIGCGAGKVIGTYISNYAITSSLLVVGAHSLYQVCK